MGRLICALALLAAVGCSGSRPSGPITLREESEVPKPVLYTDTFDMVDNMAPQEEPAGTRYFEAPEAPGAPDVQAQDASGRPATVELARGGSVTLVVVWYPEDRRGVAAMKYVGDLAAKYNRLGVRAVSLLLPTRESANGPELAHSFGVEAQHYFDNTSLDALKALAGAARADKPTAAPAVFIVDAGGRLRFYRPGFAHVLSTEQEGGENLGVITEGAPPGKTIEDYLQGILRER